MATSELSCAARPSRGRRRPARGGGIAGFVLVVAIGVTGCVSGDVPAAPPDDPVLVQGQTLYANNCVTCHGAEGGGGTGSRLNGGRVIERYPDVADQLDVVANGQRAMPSFAEKFTDEELDAVVRYTREVIAEQ